MIDEREIGCLKGVIVPRLSVLLPAFNEAPRILNAIYETHTFLESLTISHEIIVVDDGSSDNTFDVAQSVAGDLVKVFRSEKNCGKGHALKKAFGHSTGELVLFLDADLDIQPNQCASLIEKIQDETIQVVVGSKSHPDSEIRYPLGRRILSFGYRTMVKVLFKLPVRDTQTGMKLFESGVLKEVFHKVQLDGYAFDLELLTLIAQRGFGIAEVPIRVDFGNKKNRMTPQVIATMFTDTVSLLRRIRR